ncbi:sterol carrier protein domain-containing protein [Metabacillus sp. JX24]|uniref:sterol carrier protein domain-containing protein n=1 Tax=Metabacillus sp. JX24 TaxID=3240759 RepID=UPI00350F68DD
MEADLPFFQGAPGEDLIVRIRELTYSGHKLKAVQVSASPFINWRSRKLDRQMKGLFEEWRNQGCHLVFFDHVPLSFKRKYGVETLISAREWRMTAECLYLRSFNSTCEVFEADGISGEYLSKQIVRKLSGHKTCLISSSGDLTDHMSVAQNSLFVANNDKGEAIGYMKCFLADQKLHIKEWAAISPKAKPALWNKIRTLPANELILTVQESDSFPYQLKNPFLSSRQLPVFIGKITNLPDFMAVFPFKNAESPLYLHVTDSSLPANSGIYCIDDGTGRAVQSAGCRSVVSVDSGILTAVLFKSLNPGILYEAGYIKGSAHDVRLLEKALPGEKPYCFL